MNLNGGFRAFVKLTTEDFDRIFTPVFSSEREAQSYAEHKLDFWPTAERFGAYSVHNAPTNTWKHGKLRPLLRESL